MRMRLQLLGSQRAALSHSLCLAQPQQARSLGFRLNLSGAAQGLLRKLQRE